VGPWAFDLLILFRGFSMAAYEHLPIFKKLMDLAVFMEETASRFPRYHKYTLGSELRMLCHRALALVVEANSTAERYRVLLGLRLVLERIKIHLMIAREVRAYQSPHAFARATEMTVDLCRQNEGWIKSTAARAGKPEPNPRSPRP